MYILTRYVVWEVLKFFLAALLFLTLLVTLGMGVKEGLSRGLPPGVMLRTMPFMLPEMLGITLPVAMLYAVSSVFGRMTGANEVTALKSLGISPMAVVWPVLVLASFMSLGTVWMYEIAATWCRPNVARIVGESIEEIAYSTLHTNHSFGPPQVSQFSIVVKRVDGRKLVQPTITIFGQPGRPKVTLRAAEAELHADIQARLLTISCWNGEVDIEGKGRISFPDKIEQTVPLVVPAADPYHRDMVAMSDISDRVAELSTRLRQLEQLREAQESLGEPPSDKDAEDIANCRHLILRLKTEPYRRWSNGFTCLCFALIGTPVAMLWRHADVLTNFFVCFLPILAIYYPLLMLGEDLSTSGRLPPISFWTGNVILAAPAVLLLRKIIRH